jgi:hypothetical protein
LVYKKQKPVDRKENEVQVNDRIKQLQIEAESVSCEDKLSDLDIAELVHEKYVDKFPDTCFIDLTKLIRVKVGSNPQNRLLQIKDNAQFVPMN